MIFRVDHIIALRPLRDQLYDFRRRVLKIIVDYHRAVTGTMIERAHDRIGLAKIPSQTNIGYILASLGYFRAYRVAFVPAAIIHQYELDRLLLQSLRHLFDEPSDAVGSVINRDAYGYQHRFLLHRA